MKWALDFEKGIFQYLWIHAQFKDISMKYGPRGKPTTLPLGNRVL